ncbi:acyl-CoA oxidase [Aspergillus oryzae 100-8]|uniref:acyl-CoA oxidase n=1 Tax=Aspergillus oryzae (strain 3.042) TaxID=1160506 RepID=I8U5G5_ASPO3|nr:acyl-CoA oxidase [Aspergillus oryzae 3.042]KDE79684.1 acyl-CoA oxidase [Aspergillus oryzae 100-8]|eukprot:EIT82120.1 acyl-CoA oxidase [Aspergillus oryzae 3.042]
MNNHDAKSTTRPWTVSRLSNMSNFTDHLRPSQPNGPEILARKRAQTHIPVDELAHHLLAQDGYLERQARILRIVEQEPLFDKKRQANLSREDLFKLALARAKLLRRLVDKHGWDIDDYKMAETLVDDVSPYYLHLHMFITTIREQASDAQQAYWLPLIESFKIIGAYAQTELGHGSNVQGLELQARWGPGSKEFILHSPMLTAQVSVRGSSRVLLTTSTARIPHSALLSRYAKLDPDSGQFSKPAVPAVVYGTMTYVRSLIVLQSRMAFARAVTIAVRYTTVRRQFRDRDDLKGPEVAVLEYPTVQIRILPLLATTYVLHYAGQAMQRTYREAREQIQAGDFSGLAHMHSLSSGLKSFCTDLVADGIETCRRALGGHGYGGASGFIRLSPDYLSRVTVEGDNWMITQQVAAYLIKRMHAAVANIDSATGNETEDLYKEFLRANRSYKVFDDDFNIVRSFHRRTIALLYDIYVERLKSSTIPCKTIDHCPHRRRTRCVICIIYSLSFIWKRMPMTVGNAHDTLSWSTNSPIVFRSGAVPQRDLDELPNRVRHLMARIEPHAVALVDAWKIPDYLLDSALGRFDGKVYEDLFHRAHRLNPLNEITFNPNYWEDELVKGDGVDQQSILCVYWMVKAGHSLYSYIISQLFIFSTKMALRLVKLSDKFSCYARGENEARFIYHEIFEDHGYDKVELPEAPFIVDVGANIGLFSLYMKEKYPLAKIIAFEPAPENFEALERNLAFHMVSTVKAYPYALGASASFAPFKYFPNMPGNSTLNVEEKEYQIQLFKENYDQTFADDMFKDAKQIMVPVNRLSLFLCLPHSNVEVIDLLKIDVEGTELEVLRGIDDRDWNKVRNIVMEVSNVKGGLDKVKQLLETKGFTVTYVAVRGIPELFKLFIVTACR